MKVNFEAEFSIRFVVRRLRYTDDSGYAVADIDGKNAEVTGYPYRSHISTLQISVLKGDFLSVVETGCVYTCNAKICRDAKYGYCYQAVTGVVMTCGPDEASNINLVAKHVDGIGRKTATDIVDALGCDCLEKIARDPSCLDNIRMTAEQRASITRYAIGGYGPMIQLRAYCKKHNLSDDIAVRLVSAWVTTDASGNPVDTSSVIISRVESDPYIVLASVDTPTVDKFVHDIGSEAHRGFNRLINIMHYILDACGSVEMTRMPELIASAQSQTLYRYVYSPAMIAAAAKRSAYFEVEEIGEKRIISTHNHGRTSRGLARRIVRWSHLRGLCDGDTARRIAGSSYCSDLDLVQRQAVQMALANRLCVLTGGPGTGKTYTVGKIVGIFKRLKKSILMCAPSAKAALRMSDATGGQDQAVTIHSALHIGPDGNCFFGHESKIDNDVIIVDEASMVSDWLLGLLFRSVRPDAIIILVGDRHQLPPVGGEAVLADIINSGLVACTDLVTVHRTRNDLALACAIIRNGSSEDIRKMDFDRYTSISTRAVCDTDIADRIVCNVRRMNQMGISIDDIMILCSRHNGPAGTRIINEAIQDLLIPDADGIEDGDGTVFRLGAKIMNLVNRRTKNGDYLANGETGIITAIDGQNITVSFSANRVCTYRISTDCHTDSVDLAYAMTVHKSQGSEAPHVIIASESGNRMKSKKSIYTALTRAAEDVLIIGDIYSTKHACMGDDAEDDAGLFRIRLAEAEKKFCSK